MLAKLLTRPSGLLGAVSKKGSSSPSGWYGRQELCGWSTRMLERRLDESLRRSTPTREPEREAERETPRPPLTPGLRTRV